MSRSANTLESLNGLFKEVYAKELENLIPDGVKLKKEIPFSPKQNRLGNNYHQPVILGHEHGVTFASSGDDAFNLNPPVSGQIQDGIVRGTQLVLRSALGYASASRSSNGDKSSFMDATKYLVKNMLSSVTKKLEIELFYGQEGYAQVASVSGATITIETSEWAPGIWAGAENMPLEVRSSDGSVSRGEGKVTSVSFEDKSITLDNELTGVVAGDVIWHKGAYNNEFAGIHKILTNTGELFGIDASRYTLWKGNIYDAGSAQLSFTKLQEAVARGVEKGLDSDVKVYVNPRTWADLLDEQAAKREYDSSYSSGAAKNGMNEIEFYSQNGMMKIVPSIYCKEGYSYILDMSCFVRIGSTDVTFRRPGQGDEFFRDLENNAGYELRCYTDQALFCDAIGRNVIIENIVNN